MSGSLGWFCKNVLAVLLTAWVCFNAQAQDYQQITLKQAIETALQRNLQKNISVQSLQIAEQQYQVARSAHWPKANFQISHIYRDQNVTLEYTRPSLAIPGLPTLPAATEEINLLGREVSTGALKFELPIYTGGKITSIVNQAELAKSIANQEVKRTNLQVVRDVKRYYLTVQMLQQLEDIATESVSLLKATQKITKAMLDSGSLSVNRLDDLKTEMASNYAQGVLVDFKAKKQSALVALANTMGLDETDTVSVNTKSTSIGIPKHDLQQLIKQAQAFNPQLDMLRLSVNLAQSKVEEEKSANLPQVAMVADLTRLQSNWDSGLSNQTNRNSWTIGLMANIPIFDGGITKHRVAASQIAYQNAQQQLKFVESGIASKLKALLIELDAAMTHAEIAEKNAVLAKEHSDLSASAQEIGALSTEKTIEAHIYGSILAAEAAKSKYTQQEQWLEIEYLLGANINE